MGSHAGRLAVALPVVIIFAGGAAAGWRPEIRLAQTIRVEVGNSFIEPQGLTAARWSGKWLPRDKCSVFGASDTKARLLAAYGRQPVGKVDDVTQALVYPGLEPWQMALLRKEEVHYVLVDRSVITSDNLAGYFFTTKITPPAWRTPSPAVIYQKFATPSTSKIFDSGDVAIYDVAQLIRERTGFKCENGLASGTKNPSRS
jgi:hypothetical protein